MELAWTAFTNLLYRVLIFIWESIPFWKDLKLWRLRWLLFSHYLASDYWMPKREGDFIYGETPFYTAHQLLKWAEIKPGDTILDLGCGRGNFLFFGAIYFNLSTVGIDFFKLYIEVSKLISRKLNVTKMQWIQTDFLELDFLTLPSPNLVYIAGTTFSDETIKRLTEKVEKLPAGTKIISLSAPLPSGKLRRLNERTFYFSWGKATAYLQKILN